MSLVGDRNYSEIEDLLKRGVKLSWLAPNGLLKWLIVYKSEAYQVHAHAFSSELEEFCVYKQVYTHLEDMTEPLFLDWFEMVYPEIQYHYGEPTEDIIKQVVLQEREAGWNVHLVVKHDLPERLPVPPGVKWQAWRCHLSKIVAPQALYDAAIVLHNGMMFLTIPAEKKVFERNGETKAGYQFKLPRWLEQTQR